MSPSSVVCGCHALCYAHVDRFFVQSVAIVAKEGKRPDITTSGGFTFESDYKARRLLLFNDMLLLAKDKGKKGEAPDAALSFKSQVNFEDMVQLEDHADFVRLSGMAFYAS